MLRLSPPTSSRVEFYEPTITSALGGLCGSLRGGVVWRWREVIGTPIGPCRKKSAPQGSTSALTCRATAHAAASDVRYKFSSGAIKFDISGSASCSHWTLAPCITGVPPSRLLQFFLLPLVQSIISHPYPSCLLHYPTVSYLLSPP